MLQYSLGHSFLLLSLGAEFMFVGKHFWAEFMMLAKNLWVKLQFWGTNLGADFLPLGKKICKKLAK
jgi:hypothetical protein